MQRQTNIHTSINIRMDVPGAVLALCLPCFLSGNVFAYDYGEEYSDSYYNEISNGDRLQSKFFFFYSIILFIFIYTFFLVLEFIFSFDYLN